MIRGKNALKALWLLMLKGIKRRDLVFRVIANVFLIAILFVYVYPFLYLITTSLKSFDDLFNLSVNWIPRKIDLSNFIKAVDILKLPHHMPISIILTGISVTTHLFIDSFIAYGLARYKFPGKGILTFVMILSILIPLQVILLPQYIEFSFFGWSNSYIPLILPLFFGFGLKSGLFIFIFRQFFLGLPKSLEEAAMIDGCGFLKTFFKIVLPTAKTSMLVCGVMATVWHWNEYLSPSIYLREANLWPLPSMLPLLYNEYSKVFLSDSASAAIDLSTAVTEATVAAGILIVIIPLLIGFAFIQKQFIEGVERTGLVE